MHVDKIILRATLTTVAVVLMLCAFMTLALCFVFPSTMMQLTYDVGMNAASVKYAQRAYDYSGDVYYAAFATEVAILDGNTEQIAHCGNQFISDDEFQTYCDARNAEKPEFAQGKYEQYVYGQVYAAQYVMATTDAEKSLVINKAFLSLETNTFPQGNAVATVVIAANKKQDGNTLCVIREKMKEMEKDGFKDGLTAADAARFEGVFALTNG